jgi:Na+/proline symporter
MGIELSRESLQVLVAFGCYLGGVMLLGVFSHRFLTRGSFVKEYFLGNRGLGPWVLALTIAATAISGGTFMGFPSLIYTNGWVMALWICSYMVVPLATMVLFGKRINQVARLAGAVTLPDVLRDRFRSPTLGILSTLLILLFLTFNLVAQFKAGGLVMKEALRLPPAPARFRDAQVMGDRLVLRFDLADGGIEEQRAPLPDESAKYLPDRTVDDSAAQAVRVYFLVRGQEISKLVRHPSQKIQLPWPRLAIDKGYLLGLVIFAATVVAYTTYGGFWAVTWTDVLEGLVMLAGVVLMAVLAVRAVPALDGQTGLTAATLHLQQQDPQLVRGPGPKGYLPLGMAFSFFLMWSLIGAGQPSGMVRLMSFKDTPSLRRALFLVSGYYITTYLCLVVIFVCARAIFPTEYLRELGSEGEPDSIMPVMARHIAHPLVAGLLLAAPYAAIMSTVAAFLLMISSSLVRDLYQRTINPDVSPRVIRIASYLVTGLVGFVVMVGALNPPGFLQYIIVFTGSGQGCTFLVPMAMALYWRRATRAGVLAGMLGGFVAVVGLYALGWTDSTLRSAGSTASAEALRELFGWIPGWGQERHDAFAPLYVGGVDPLVWGLLASLVLGIGVSLLTKPDEALVRKFYPGEA